jgi:anti-sigma factor RsiW
MSSMRACAEVVRLLLEYLEERLPADRREALERHLKACPRCEAQLRTYRSTVSLLHTLRDEDLPLELRMTVRAFLEGSKRH